MDQREYEQRVNAYVSRKLTEMATEREGDLRVQVVGHVNSEVTYNISEFQNGAWKLIHERVSRSVFRRLTSGRFICRNQDMGRIVGDYREHEPVVAVRIPCSACGREYTFRQYGPSQLSVNGYCSIPCAISVGVPPDEAARQAQEHMVYIGE